MALWSEQIVLPEKKTVSIKQNELLLSNRGEWLGVATIGISRVGSHTQEEEVRLGGEFRNGPYTFGLFTSL